MIDKKFHSGTTATFTMKAGEELDREALRDSVKKKGLRFLSLECRAVPRAAAAFVAVTPGLT